MQAKAPSTEMVWPEMKLAAGCGPEGDKGGEAGRGGRRGGGEGEVEEEGERRGWWGDRWGGQVV